MVCPSHRHWDQNRSITVTVYTTTPLLGSYKSNHMIRRVSLRLTTLLGFTGALVPNKHVQRQLSVILMVSTYINYYKVISSASPRLTDIIVSRLNASCAREGVGRFTWYWLASISGFINYQKAEGLSIKFKESLLRKSLLWS